MLVKSKPPEEKKTKKAPSHKKLECPWKNLDSKFHPKHRIFLSIDAIGSTQLKSTLAQHGHTPGVWAKHFMAFLPEVEVIYWKKFVDVVNTCCNVKACNTKCVPLIKNGKLKKNSSLVQAKVWKYIGDEVVLVAELTCPKLHPALHVLALTETLKHFNDNFKNYPITIGKEKKALQFKGTAWVAGFPVTNIEIILSAHGKDIADYLGPSIDLGFRLSKFASRERLIISASLAHLIVAGNPLDNLAPYMEEPSMKLPLCFGGSVEAKGVKSGKHPLIWYPVIETEENNLCRVTSDDLINFLKKEHFKDISISPFILNDSFGNRQYFAEYKKAIAEQSKVPNSIFYSSEVTQGHQSSHMDNADELNANDVLKRIPAV